MISRKYQLPEFLIGRCTPEGYKRWLGRKAIAHVRRDRGRGHKAASREAYMMAIHQCVIDSKGYDCYTNEPLAWEIISTYDNDASKAGKRQYKKSFWNLPTVDHVGDDLSANAFRICSWRTNDCKNDLSEEELIEFCRLVLDFYEKNRITS
jgi:hypothetical protein